MDAGQDIVVHFGQERRQEIGGRIAVHGIEIDGHALRGLVVQIDDQRRDGLQPKFARRRGAMVAADDLVFAGSAAQRTQQDRNEKAIALDTPLQRFHFVRRQILRIALQLRQGAESYGFLRDFHWIVLAGSAGARER